MKKLVCLLTAAILITALMSGCATETPADTTTDTPADTVTTDTSGVTTKDSVIKAGKLVIATSPDYPPFEYMEGSTPVGIDMEMAQAIADDWGVELQIDTIDFDGVLAAISSGKCDLGVSALSIKPERLESMTFSDPYFDSVVKIAVKADSGIKSSADLSGKTVSAQMGTIAAGIAESLGAEVVRMKKDSEAVAELMNGRVDAFMTDAAPAAVHVSNSDGALILLDEELAFDDKYCMATKKGNDDLIAAVNETLKKLIDSGKLEEIINKYQDKFEDEAE